MERTRSYGHKLVSILLALLLACSFGLSTGLSYSLAYAADDDTQTTTTTDISTIGISDCGNQFYTGSEIQPFSDSVKSNVGRVYEGEDYTVEYSNNIELGTATATLTGMGDYSGTLTMTFDIVEYALTVTVGDYEVSFTRDQLEELAADSTDNTEGVAYQYGSNVIYVPAKGYVTYATLLEYVGVGEWTQLVSTASDGFSVTLTADIVENGQFYPASTGSGNYDTTGAESTPGCLCLQWVSDSITSTAGALATELASTDADAYETTVRTMTGITEEDFLAGNNSGGNRFVTNVCAIEVTGSLDIASIGISDCGDQFYTGSAIKPFSGNVKSDVGRVYEGTDYEVEYANNVKLGTATATLTGIGDYSGTAIYEFNIVEYTLTVTVGDYEVSYTRDQLEELAANSTDNTEEAAYQYGSNVIYVPAKSYVTYATLLEDVGVDEWTELVPSASDGFSTTITTDIVENGQFYPASTGSDNYDITGAESVPACLCLQWTSGSITSTAGATKTELASTDADAYETTVRTLTGITEEDFLAGNNSGGNRFVTNVCALDVTGTMAEIDISTIGISDCGDQYYTGSAIEPFSGSVKSNVGRVYEGTDYEVEYANNVERGTATATLTGMGDYTGTVTFEFAIIDYTLTISMSDGTVAFSFTHAQLEELAANSTDNTEGVAYQYGNNVLYVPAKGYVTYETLLEAAGCTSWNSLVSTASDGFSVALTTDIVENGQFYPASTGSGNYDITGAESTPGCLCLQWVSGSITSTAGAAAEALAQTAADAYETTVRSMTGITEADFLAGENSGGNRLVTNVCEITIGEEGTFLSDNITDNDAGEWFYEYVVQVVNGGIMEGYRDDAGNLTGVFGVTDSITRGQVATVLWRMAGSPEVEGITAFSDVDYSLYYGDAVDWARSTGIIKGYEDTGYTMFGPDNNVTREELATMIARYAKSVSGIEVSDDVDTTAASELLGWSDVSSWAQDSFAWCVNNGVVTGIDNGDGTYSASSGDYTERSMMAAMVIRMLTL